MIEVTAAVNLPRLQRGSTALVDETDDRIRKLIRGGYLIPLEHGPPVTLETPPAKQERGA